MLEDPTRFRRKATEWGAAAIVFAAAVGMLFLFGRMPRHRQAQQPSGPVPEIRFQLPSGEESSLASYRGKVLLLNFWASWCLPCMEEMASLRKLEDKLGEKGLVLLAFNVDGEAPSVVKGFEPRELPRSLIFSYDLSQLDPFAFDVIPVSLLVDRSGTIRKRFVGPRDWVSPSVLREISGFL